MNILNKIPNLVSKDLDLVDEFINNELESKEKIIKTAGHHLIDLGGKRLRPLLIILLSNGFNYLGNEHIILSVVVEFIHTATLLHDDVIDQGGVRRGKDTANLIWGNRVSVLTGDFLLSKAFELVNRIDKHKVRELITSTTRIIVEGEVRQLINLNNQENLLVDQAEYMRVIAAKQVLYLLLRCNYLV